MLRGLVRAAARRYRARSAPGSGSPARARAHVVDLRSDAVTKPVRATDACHGQGSHRRRPAPRHPDLDQLEWKITRGLGSSYHQVCELICLESTHNSSGGRVLFTDHLHQGLGAPVASLVGGTKDSIKEAWCLRKALGCWPWLSWWDLLKQRRRCRGITGTPRDSPKDPGTRLQELASPICSVDLSTVETNMVTLKMDRLPPEVLCGRLQAVGADQVAQTSHVVRVLLFPWMGRSVCAMGHRDISAQDTKLALRKQEFVLRQLGP